MYTQHDRPIRVDTPLGEDVLLLEAFAGREQVSAPFSFRLRLLSENRSLAAEKLLRQPAVVTLFSRSRRGQRFFHGRFRSFSQLGAHEGLTVYEGELTPWLWFLSLRSDCRIFQKKHVPDIVEQVFREHGEKDFRIDLSRQYSEREYCVQYRESDLAFVTRLLEEEGIFYYFEHQRDKHILVLSDTTGGVKPCPGQETARFDLAPEPSATDDVVLRLERRHSVGSRSVALNDYDFQKPRFKLDVAAGAAPRQEIYDYPGRYITRELGERYARIRLEEQEAHGLLLHGDTNCRAFTPGYRFQLAGHFRADFNDSYMLLAAEHDVKGGDFRAGGNEAFSYHNRIEAMPARVPYRPPRVTPRPLIRGSQTAVVVGPAAEEIWTDTHGRVKVQFHWDRQGRHDDGSSCWIRVSQSWAGAGWGAMQIPRVGQEVIVDFLEGDPDQPIITGRVYNADQTPPWELPANKTASGVKSRSTRKGASPNFNEIRFEDRKGHEELILHAERDKSETVERDSHEHVGRDRFLTVKRDRIEMVERDAHVTVKGDRREHVAGDWSLEVGHDRHEKIGSVYAIEAGQEIHVKSGGKLVLESGQELTLKSSGGFVKIDASGVTIQGSLVKINSSGGAAGSGSGVRIKQPRAPGTPAAPQHAGVPAPPARPAAPRGTALASIGLAAAILSQRRRTVKTPTVKAPSRSGPAILGALGRIKDETKKRAVEFWNKGKPEPVHLKEQDSFLDGSRSRDRQTEWSRDSRITKKGLVSEKEKSRGIEKSLSVSHTWAETEGALRKWGGDKNNVKLGSFGFNAASGITRTKDGTTVDVIRAGAHVTAASGEFDKNLIGDTLTAQGSLKVLNAEAEASVGAEWSKKAKDVHAKVGASLDLVKGEIGGQFKIPIPFTKHAITLGGGVEGQVGASAEAKGYAGWNQKEGFGLGFKIKAGLGLGGGLNFKIGFK